MQINVDDISGVIKLRNKTCEEAVFTGIVQWVNHNPLLREKMFANLFSQLELSQMGYDFMTAASKENLVRSNLICSNYLVDNLLKHYRPTANSDLYKFLVIGGKKFLTNCVAYDVNTKQATQLPKLNTGRMRATSVNVGSKVCVFGGAGEGKVYKSCEMLDFVEQTKWKVMPDMLKSRQDFSSCSFEDHIYVTGGYNNYKRLSSCERFSSNNNTWSRIKDMIHARDEHGTVVCDRFLYCIGGSGDNKTLSSCERFDVRSDVWNEIAPLNQARHGLVTVVLNKEIYAIGGLDDEGQYLSSVERFNPEIGKWRILHHFNMLATVHLLVWLEIKFLSLEGKMSKIVCYSFAPVWKH
uniref:Kelch-like protein 20 n=1 Tax=Phallusia mammillata TaxID=59560 RepID=A0A6F9DGI9_9ASCI|nr:kelch-like protein 20 [Phallusia mammillata]